VSCAGDILIEGKQLSQLTARLDFFRGWCFMHYLLPFSQAAARVAASRRDPLSHFGALYHAGARTKLLNGNSQTSWIAVEEIQEQPAFCPSAPPANRGLIGRLALSTY